MTPNEDVSASFGVVKYTDAAKAIAAKDRYTIEVHAKNLAVLPLRRSVVDTTSLSNMIVLLAGALSLELCDLEFCDAGSELPNTMPHESLEVRCDADD
jgi:hypothetical protein